MTNIKKDTIEKFRQLNALTNVGSSVLFGSGRFAELSAAEMAQGFGVDVPVCNRSIAGLTLEQAPTLLDECVLSLRPGKVFLNFGECAIKAEGFDKTKFLNEYQTLIDAIRQKSDCGIYVVSVVSDSPAAREVNRQLASLARRNRCSYVDCTDSIGRENPDIRLFSDLAASLRSHRISFSDAMNAVCG